VNYDECAIAINPSIEDGKRTVSLAMSIQFTDLSGTVYYWYPYGNNPTWTTSASLASFTIPTQNEVTEFKFSSVPESYMVSPLLSNGNVAIFEETLP
jgi:hypothetical protein